MIEGSTDEDEWITHELAGHTHREEMLEWDQELGMPWAAELRCKDCEACRYIPRNEAVQWLAAKNLVAQKELNAWPIRPFKSP